MQKQYRIKYLRRQIDNLTNQSKTLRRMIDDFENCQSYAENIQCNFDAGSKEYSMCLIEGIAYSSVIENLKQQEESVILLLIELNKELKTLIGEEFQETKEKN